MRASIHRKALYTALPNGIFYFALLVAQHKDWLISAHKNNLEQTSILVIGRARFYMLQQAAFLVHALFSLFFKTAFKLQQFHLLSR